MAKDALTQARARPSGCMDTVTDRLIESLHVRAPGLAACTDESGLRRDAGESTNSLRRRLRQRRPKRAETQKRVGTCRP
eukprot:6267374-Prymnesium_polylepis.1